MIREILNSFGMTLVFLRRLVADVEDARLAEQPGGAANHPAWVLGHLADSCQAMAGELGGAAWLPEGWGERFGTGSVPVADRAAYPEKDALLTVLDEGERRLAEFLSAMTDADLSVPLPDARYRDRFPTLGHAVLHILGAHAAVHVGQVTVWRRAAGLPPLSEPFV